MDKRDFARQPRRRPTDAERLLWRHLSNRRFAGFKFRRQEPVGAYIPDFVCHEGSLIVELDGGQHAGQRAYDERRDVWLASQGFRVLRFPDNYVLTNLQGALERIWQALGVQPSQPKRLLRRSRQGGDGKEK